MIAQILGETGAVGVEGRLMQRGAGRRSLGETGVLRGGGGILRKVGMGEFV